MALVFLLLLGAAEEKKPVLWDVLHVAGFRSLGCYLGAADRVNLFVEEMKRRDARPTPCSVAYRQVDPAMIEIATFAAFNDLGRNEIMRVV